MQELINHFENALRRIIREEINVLLETIPKLAAPVEKQKQSEKPLTTKEAAEYCGVSPVTLWRLRRTGEIGFFRIGNRALYSVEKHLIPFLETRERKPIQRSRRG